MIIILSSCEDIIHPEPANNPEAIFEDLWTRFQEEYAPFEERGVDWEAQYVKYRPMVAENTSDDELFTILSSMLGSLDDGHVSLTAPGRKIFFSNTTRNMLLEDSIFQLEVIRQHYLEPGYKSDEDESYLYGKLKNTNIGYIFFDHVGENFLILDDFLKEFEDADGYIIDLRHNQGGDFTYAFSALGQLTKDSRYVFKSKTKNGPGEEDYTPWHSWYLEPEGTYTDKAIVVLTDRYTISAGERAVMAFKTLPQVTIIGDTTNGAHGTMIGRELANGWFYSLVPQKVELFDGKSYEGVGLAPDVYEKNSLAEISAGKDRTLERAVEELEQ
ncbi:peptidase s41 [Flammeovirgaceae bacterium 311]|nr:peptidase s41 [Flammeovirgaceae bacterium 311]